MDHLFPLAELKYNKNTILAFKWCLLSILIEGGVDPLWGDLNPLRLGFGEPVC